MSHRGRKRVRKVRRLVYEEETFKIRKKSVRSQVRKTVSPDINEGRKDGGTVDIKKEG